MLPSGDDRTDQAFVVTPDELRLEILEDKNQKFPIRHHHVHFNVPESAILRIKAWYALGIHGQFTLSGQSSGLLKWVDCIIGTHAV